MRTRGAGTTTRSPTRPAGSACPGLVAQGLQVAGPAYGLLLDEWGEDFLAHGELELKFVGMVLDDQTVDATVEAEGDDAGIEVTNRSTAKVAVVGSARRVGGR